MPSKYLIPLLTSSALAFSISPVWGQSNTTSEITFTCEGDGDIPITVAKNSQGKTQPIFHWKPEALPASTDIQKFCSSVAEKLNGYAAEGYNLSMFDLVPSEQAGLPVICITQKKYYDCDKVLFTLFPTERPLETVEKTLEENLDPTILNNQNRMSYERYVPPGYEVNLVQLFKDE